MVFYATSSGVIFEPLSKEAKRMDHDVGQVRDRLRQKLWERQEQQEAESKEFWEQEDDEMKMNSGQTTTNDAEEGTTTTTTGSTTTDLEIAKIEQQLREQRLTLERVDQQNEYNKFLAHQQFLNKKGESKALPGQYVYKPDEADNAAKRAIVHHTGSHYHMAGSRQFQRGVRVQGVVSRHSKQGAKLQAARMAKRNGLDAREDARGQRNDGGVSGGKQHKSGKKKKKKNAE